MTREELLDSLRKLLESDVLRVATPEELAASVILVSRVSEFDEKSNALWSVPENRSYPRDVVCSHCLEPVVMSDGMFQTYVDGKRKQKVICMTCVLRACSPTAPMMWED